MAITIDRLIRLISDLTNDTETYGPVSCASSVLNKKGITSRIYRKNVRENQGAATAGVHHTHSWSF